MFKNSFGISGSEIIFVALPTPHHADYDGRYPTSDLEPKDFDYTILKSVVEEANQYCTKEQLMVIISTTMPGTIREQIAPLASNVRLVYNPYLIALGTIRGRLGRRGVLLAISSCMIRSCAGVKRDVTCITLRLSVSKFSINCLNKSLGKVV